MYVIVYYGAGIIRSTTQMLQNNQQMPKLIRIWILCICERAFFNV